MRCEECDDLYPESALDLCSECGLWVCAACEFVIHDCAGIAITYTEYVAAEAKMTEWNARVSEWNAGQRRA